MCDSTELVAVDEMAKVRIGLSSAVAELKNKCETFMGGTGLNAVPTTDEGWIWDSDHEVTGSELNTVITGINRIVSDFLEEHRATWGNFIEVYKTIDSLDRDYLSKIEKSFEQINANYEKIKANNQEIRRSQADIENHRERIDELIQGHEIALKVLRKFKDQIDGLSHLEEINRQWETLDIGNALKQIDINYHTLIVTAAKQDKAIAAVENNVRAINKAMVKWILCFVAVCFLVVVACVLLVVLR